MIVQKILPHDPVTCWIFFRTTLQWSSPQMKHIFICPVKLISKTLDIGQRKTLENYTRNRYIVKKLSCGCALSKVGLIGPYFFEDKREQTVTVNSEQYVVMLQDFFIAYLEEDEWNIPHVWFQLDGATAHTARVSMNVIRKTFAGRLISRNGDIPWQLRLSDLSPCIFFLWGYLHKFQSVPRQTTHYSRIKRVRTMWNCTDSCWQMWWETSTIFCKNALVLKDTINQK